MAYALAMIVIGVDLSGPANARDTAVVVFRGGPRRARLVRATEGADDAAIYGAIEDARSSDHLVVGLDAPLSYNGGGSDRPADSALRKRAVAAGLAHGSVMPPTMPRMGYLTLRGISVARGIALTRDDAVIVEVHPGAALVLRGASAADVRGLKTNARSRRRLLRWLEDQGLGGADKRAPSDHYVAACAGALAAWRWRSGQAVWEQPADPPHHPFPFVC